MSYVNVGTVDTGGFIPQFRSLDDNLAAVQTLNYLNINDRNMLRLNPPDAIWFKYSDGCGYFRFEVDGTDLTLIRTLQIVP